MSILNARTWNVSASGPGSTEKDYVREPASVAFDIEHSALVIIDAWATHPNEGWAAREAQNIPNLLRLINAFRAKKRPIFYDPTGVPMNQPILDGWTQYDHVIDWESSGDGTNILNNLLIQSNVNAIFWGGYAANLCLMHKPCGFRNIMPKDWSRLQFLVRDATIGQESSETLAEQRLWDAACYEVEYYHNGYSCTVESIEEAFGMAVGPLHLI